MAPSVAALKIHAVWCRHTSQLSAREREGGKKREGDRHIDRYNLKHLRLKQGRDRQRMSEGNRDDTDKGARNGEGRALHC